MNPGPPRPALPEPLDDPLISLSAKPIRYAVRILAVLMVLVIWWGSLMWSTCCTSAYSTTPNHPIYLLNINEIFATFGAFMAVLIAIEIFINITSYLRENVIHIKIVLATHGHHGRRPQAHRAGLQRSRSDYVFANAALVLALAVAYWLAVVKNPLIESHDEL